MRIFLTFLVLSSSWIIGVMTASAAVDTSWDVNLRKQVIGTSGTENQALKTFSSQNGISSFFFTPTLQWDSVTNTFISIAFAIKNFFIAVAVLFLIIGVLKLLFSWGDEEVVKKWRRNIIWVSVGIFVMQIATSIWNLLYFVAWDSRDINGRLGWQFWTSIFEPIVNVLQLLAGFGFLLMMVYAFYTIVTGGWDEEKLKKGKNIVIYSIVGFLLIRLPQAFVTAIYGEPKPACRDDRIFTIGTCLMGEKKLEWSILIFGKILTYLNGFIFLLSVILVIYAGWLVLISWGDEEKLKKAKQTVIYILVGIVILVASHAIFRFFILRG